MIRPLCCLSPCNWFRRRGLQSRWGILIYPTAPKRLIHIRVITPFSQSTPFLLGSFERCHFLHSALVVTGESLQQPPSAFPFIETVQRWCR